MLSVNDFIARKPVLYGSILLSSLLIFRKLLVKFLSPRKLPLPPGPKGLPLLGNVSDLPPPGVPEWRHWLKFKDLYGPISSITIFGQTIIVIHDREIVSELLEKRSAKFSERPHMRFASDLCGYGRMMGFEGNNVNHRTQRKFAAKQMGSKTSVKKYHSAIEFQVQRFLYRTMETPKDRISHIQFEAGSFILANIYGYNTNPIGSDPLIDLINEMMVGFSEATIAGAWPVDLFPWFEYIPEWFPGVQFKRFAREHKKILTQATDTPYAFTKQMMSQGTANQSYVQGLLTGERSPSEIANIKRSALSLYGGGADTTVANLEFFFLAMSLFPEVQRKAQEEIDRVIGADAMRLPGFEDRDNLPYIEAVLKEALRWFPIAPLGLPHSTDEEDVFHGYRIPKGSIIMPSLGWFSRDPTRYPEPDRFNPDRFLGPNPQEDPHTFVFGFGRRICPGRQLADSNLYLMIAQTLAVFDIKRNTDLDARTEIELTQGQTPGTISHPTPFECTITPRTQAHRDLIVRVHAANPDEEGDAASLQALEV
ncbi:hypothetical protein H072_1058 [Dactylellina haptotyla CBS 200.50]|uniref:Cytochrome P450 n=1 Tax=Dactylellina haptotyla (strain CBS 200.50) TaxID=1284197 RepID=S8C021_DACHA|nr:hypothetical protein H072_1058 [Dactylellina haptotyla CBS 200.50]